MGEAVIEGLVLRKRGDRATVSPITIQSKIVGPQPFEFTGTGAEYFRIWVVNLLLTLVTLGIYSAWAKVRRLQYFYRNTRVAGAIFDYHGNPKAILKGRFFALFLLAAYKIALDISTIAAVAMMLILAGIMPWLLARAFRFKMVNSSYRGLRFRFLGTAGMAYRMLILFPASLAITAFFVWTLVASFGRDPGIGVVLLVGVLPLAALAVVLPLAHYFLKRFQHDNAYYGQTPFFFDARPKDFLKIYAKTFGFFFLGLILATIFGFLTADMFALPAAFGWLLGLIYSALSFYALVLFAFPYLQSRIQNVVWNNTELGEHRFESAVSARKLLWIHASNLMLIGLTIGLFKPFAVVRLAKYKVECLTLIPAYNLEEFLADRSADNTGATGEEAGDLFDIDIAL